MRGFVTVVLFIIFFFSFSIAVFVFAVNSIAKPNYVKGLLVESKIYSVVAEELPDIISNSKNGDDELVPQEIKTQLADFTRKEVTAEYLQGKIEPFVDDIFTWLDGETDTEPSLSFSDLADKIEPLGVSYLLSEDFNEMISQPVIFAPEGNIQLRTGYQWSQALPIIFSGLAAIAIIVIFLMAKGWRSKLRKVSLALFIPTILGFASVASTLLTGNLLVGAAQEEVKGTEFEQFSQSINDLLTKIKIDISIKMEIIFGIDE
jgi:hypothetical protein